MSSSLKYTKKKSRYRIVYNLGIYPVNGSNLWVKAYYLNVQPSNYKKDPGRPKKKMNLDQGEFDGFDRKMRRVWLIICNVGRIGKIHVNRSWILNRI